jgi:hypothetical protein
VVIAAKKTRAESIESEPNVRHGGHHDNAGDVVTQDFFKVRAVEGCHGATLPVGQFPILRHVEIHKESPLLSEYERATFVTRPSRTRPSNTPLARSGATAISLTRRVLASGPSCSARNTRPRS